MKIKAPLTKAEKDALNKAKELLEFDLKRGAIPLQSCPGFMPRDVCRMRPEYQVIPYDAFTSRLYSARRRHQSLQKQASEHSAALQNSRERYAKPSHNVRGEPRWEGSEAAALLKSDVADGKHRGVLPAALRASRPEYQLFSLHVFRRHIHQEEKTLKFINQQKAKRLSKASTCCNPNDDDEVLMW